MSLTVHELDYSLPQEVYAAGDGPAYEFPFEALGDFSTFIVARKYKQLRSAYLVDKLANKFRKGETIDPAGSGGILIDTQETGATATGLQSFTRRYALIPPTQTDARHSLMVNLPTPNSSWTWAAVYVDGVQLVQTGVVEFASGYILDGRSTIYYDVYPQKPISAKPAISGGTFNYTYKTSTASGLNWNDSGATIAAAINGLASIVADGITVTASNQLSVAANRFLQINATVGSFLAMASVDFSTLTPLSAAQAVATSPDSMQFTVYCKVPMTVTAHGITNTGQNLAGGSYVANESAFIVSSSNWSVYDANTILIANPLTLSSIAGDQSFLGAFVRRYVPGSVPAPCTITTRFSLSAIAPDTYQGDTYNFLVALFSGSTSINYRVGDATPWPDDKSPINSLATTSVSAANL